MLQYFHRFNYNDIILIMQTKYLIFNSDDFGMSEAFNEAILRGFTDGNLTSTCVVANADEFDDAIKNVLPRCGGLGLGVHLNLFEGKALTKSTLLCDENGFFDKSFVQVLLNSYNASFLNQVELEFRKQIETVQVVTKVDHLNSHVHFHAIPKIFELTCKLAKEYNIEFIRTQYEKPYFVLNKMFTKTFVANTLKVVILNIFSVINKFTVKKYGLKTNDYVVGVGYTGFMDFETIIKGLRAIKKKDCVVEIITHPNFYKRDDIKNPARYKEYLAVMDEKLAEQIKKQGWSPVNYRHFSS